MANTDNLRADAYRHVAKRYFITAVLWAAIAACVGYEFGYWAVVPAVLGLRSFALCVISLSREAKMRKED